MMTLGELQVSIANIMNLASQVLRVVRAVDTAVDTFRMTFDVIRLLQGDIINVIRRRLEDSFNEWRNAPPGWRTARLFREDFWQDAASTLLNHSGEIVTRIITRQGRDIVSYYNSLRTKQFRWVIYMPTPAEPQLANPYFRIRLPGLKILDRTVMLHFGPPGTGRLFGLGFEKKGDWQSQFFRMDYHRPHDGNWVVQGDRYDFNFHVDGFNRDMI